MRRLAALIDALPADSALRRAQHHGWTQAHELAVLQIEITDMWGRILAITHGQDRHNLPAPPDIQHPGRPRAAKPLPTTDPAAIRSFFARK